MTADAHYLTCYARAIKFVKSGSDESTPVLFKKQEKTKGADPTGLREHKMNVYFKLYQDFLKCKKPHLTKMDRYQITADDNRTSVMTVMRAVREMESEV